MDSKDITSCLRDSDFVGRLRGITSVDTFRCPHNLGDGDCIVFNTDNTAGQHWFCVLYCKGVCYLFDSSLLTPTAMHGTVTSL